MVAHVTTAETGTVPLPGDAWIVPVGGAGAFTHTVAVAVFDWMKFVSAALATVTVNSPVELKVMVCYAPTPDPEPAHPYEPVPEPPEAVNTADWPVVRDARVGVMVTGAWNSGPTVNVAAAVVEV